MEYIETSYISITVSKWIGPELPYYNKETKKLYIKIIENDEYYNIIEDKNNIDFKTKIESIKKLIDDSCDYIYQTHKMKLSYDLSNITSIYQLAYSFCSPYYGKDYIVLCIPNVIKL